VTASTKLFVAFPLHQSRFPFVSLFPLSFSTRQRDFFLLGSPPLRFLGWNPLLSLYHPEGVIEPHAFVLEIAPSVFGKRFLLTELEISGIHLNADLFSPVCHVPLDPFPFSLCRNPSWPVCLVILLFHVHFLSAFSFPFHQKKPAPLPLFSVPLCGYPLPAARIDLGSPQAFFFFLPVYPFCHNKSSGPGNPPLPITQL